MPMQRVWQQVVALIDGILDFLEAAIYVVVVIMAFVTMGSISAYSSGVYSSGTYSSSDAEFAGVMGALGGLASFFAVMFLVSGLLYVLFGVLATRAFALPSRPGGYFGVGIARLVIVALTTVPGLLSRDATLEQLAASSGMSYSDIATLTSLSNTVMVLSTLHLARSIFRVVVAAQLRPIALQQQAMMLGMPAPYGSVGAYPQATGYPQQQGTYQPQAGGYPQAAMPASAPAYPQATPAAGTYPQQQPQPQAGGYPQQGAAQQGTAEQLPSGNAGGTWQ